MDIDVHMGYLQDSYNIYTIYIHIRGDCHHIWLKSSINIAWEFPPGSVPPSLSADSCSWHWLYCCTCKAGAAFVNPPIYVGLVDECRAGWLFYMLFTWLMSLAGSQVCPLERVEESKMQSLEMLKAHGDSAKLLVVPQYVGFLVQPQRQWGWSQVLSEDSLLHQDHISWSAPLFVSCWLFVSIWIQRLQNGQAQYP